MMYGNENPTVYSSGYVGPTVAYIDADGYWVGMSRILTSAELHRLIEAKREGVSLSIKGWTAETTNTEYQHAHQIFTQVMSALENPENVLSTTAPGVSRLIVILPEEILQRFFGSNPKALELRGLFTYVLPTTGRVPTNFPLE